MAINKSHFSNFRAILFLFILIEAYHENAIDVRYCR
jgi:hypothetical protein